MLDEKITFDRVVRWLLVALGAGAAVWLVNRLSGVLLPFFIAWLLAYMLYPFVTLLQHRMHLRSRALSIAVAMLIVLTVICGALALIIPPIIEESVRLSHLITVYFHDTLVKTNLTGEVERLLRQYSSSNSLLKLVQQSSFVEAIEGALIQAWNLLSSTLDFALGILNVFIVLLYMFFILMDYEKISNGWTKLIPSGKREFTAMVVQDVKNGMNAYFRGQALVALCVGILFSIGFLIIDFPMAIGLGLFIGLLNLVPYMQLIGFIPTILLALLKAADTGQSFWIIIACALAVFAIVQLIQDMYLTPKIMGHVMGLNPAIILLSLSVWGSLLGIIGFIIALPLTTLLLSYYRRFILKEGAKEA